MDVRSRADFDFQRRVFALILLGQTFGALVVDVAAVTVDVRFPGFLLPEEKNLVLARGGPFSAGIS